MAVSRGAIVDATLIDAPSSTKNKAGKRDPEMHQAKKGNQWYFGMKVPRGRGQSKQADSFGGGDGGERPRLAGSGGSSVWRGDPGVGRFGLQRPARDLA